MLPAADAQVAAVAAALTATRSPDVRARLEELAVLVQRLCDAHRELAGDAPDRAPIAALVELARTTAAAIDAVDGQLATLDEGTIVRALARSEARREAPALRADLLAGLDTLRRLEDQRAVLFGRLLEITSLTRAAIDLQLTHAAASRTDDLEVARAFEALRDVP
jgi:superfamily II DNA helicase RecQ